MIESVRPAPPRARWRCHSKTEYPRFLAPKLRTAVHFSSPWAVMVAAANLYPFWTRVDPATNADYGAASAEEAPRRTPRSSDAMTVSTIAFSRGTRGRGGRDRGRGAMSRRLLATVKADLSHPLDAECTEHLDIAACGCHRIGRRRNQAHNTCLIFAYLLKTARLDVRWGKKLLSFRSRIPTQVTDSEMEALRPFMP